MVSEIKTPVFGSFPQYGDKLGSIEESLYTVYNLEQTLFFVISATSLYCFCPSPLSSHMTS